MKKLVTLLALSLCLAVGFEATAQMDKKEKKEWKKRIKKLEPEQYKTLIDENKTLKSQVSSLKSELTGVDDRLSEKDDQISQFQSQVASLRDELAAANQRAQAAASRPAPQQEQGINDQEGVVFKVQIGAYTNKDLSKYVENSENFSQENGDGLNKYSLGVFRDYWEADTFKKYLREMGVKDAWIVSYRDGQRVPIEEVLAGIADPQS